MEDTSMVIKENRRRLNEGNNEISNNDRDIDYFHELIKGFGSAFAEADEASVKAMESLWQAIEYEKIVAEKRKEAEALLFKAYEWLSRNSQRYGCHVSEIASVQLARQLQALGKKLGQLESEGTKKAEEALELLQQAETVKRKLGKKTEKYIESVHGKNSEVGCGFQDDYLWE